MKTRKIRFPYACGTVWCTAESTGYSIAESIEYAATIHSLDVAKYAQAVSKAVDDSIWNYTGSERTVSGFKSLEQAIDRADLMDMLAEYQFAESAYLDALRKRAGRLSLRRQGLKPIHD